MNDIREKIFDKITEIVTNSGCKLYFLEQRNGYRHMNFYVNKIPSSYYRDFFKTLGRGDHYLRTDEWLEEFADSLYLLAHADFSEVERDSVPRELEAVRPRGIKKFYAFYSTLKYLSDTRITEVVFLEDLIRESRVYTADAGIADDIVRFHREGRDYNEFLEEYKKSLVEVKSLSIPIYERVVVGELPLPVKSNEFMVVTGMNEGGEKMECEKLDEFDFVGNLKKKYKLSSEWEYENEQIIAGLKSMQKGMGYVGR